MRSQMSGKHYNLGFCLNCQYRIGNSRVFHELDIMGSTLHCALCADGHRNRCGCLQLCKLFNYRWGGVL